MDDEVSRALQEFSLHIVPAADIDGILGLAPGNCSGSGRVSGGIEDFRKDGFSRPEARWLSVLLGERAFSLVVQLRGGQAEDVVIPQGAAIDEGKLCRTATADSANLDCLAQQSLIYRLASSYLSSLHGSPPSTCPAAATASSSSSPGVTISSSPASLGNHVWDRFGQTVFLSPGVGAGGRDGCCASPTKEDMGTAWDRHRASLIGLVTSPSLQGIHVEVTGAGYRPDFEVHVAELDLLLRPVPGFAHLWHLLKENAYTVRVSVDGYVDQTKLVRVDEGTGFTHAIFAVEPKVASVPRFVVACLSMTVFLLLLLCFMATKCRRRARGRARDRRRR